MSIKELFIIYLECALNFAEKGKINEAEKLVRTLLQILDTRKEKI